jgi:hypothetical protein
VAKYLEGQSVVALNPDPERIDGVLLPFDYLRAQGVIALALSRRAAWREVTMAQATLNDGQSLLAVNDLFVGQKTYTSAHYQIRLKDREEDQSSSGIIISTGAASTGWYHSVVTEAVGIAETLVGNSNIRKFRDEYCFDWDASWLVFSVREPFVSKTSGAELVSGMIDQETPLEIASHMPQNRVIFSDGIEEDHLDFNSSAIATIGLADRTLRLVVPV